MSLFEPKVTNFVIKWAGEKPSESITAKIENNNGEEVGSIISRGMIKPKTELLDSENSAVLTVVSGMLRDKFKIKSATGEVIGIAKEKSQLHKPKLVIEDLSKNEIVTVLNLSHLPGSHEVISPNKTVVAKFDVGINEVKISNVRSKHDYICNFQIIDQAFDRKIIWGSFLSFLNIYFNEFPTFGPGG